jgi:hypothetical protein
MKKETLIFSKVPLVVKATRTLFPYYPYSGENKGIREGVVGGHTATKGAAQNKGNKQLRFSGTIGTLGTIGKILPMTLTSLVSLKSLNRAIDGSRNCGKGKMNSFWGFRNCGKGILNSFRGFRNCGKGKMNSFHGFRKCGKGIFLQMPSNRVIMATVMVAVIINNIF